jgi:hypothetical protein
MWKETTQARVKILPLKLPGGTEETTEDLRWGSRRVGRDSKGKLPKHNSEVLTA